MSQADRIRQFIVEHYIKPARLAGWTEVTIRAGDVHREMGLSNRLPAVCSVLVGEKFSKQAMVSKTHRGGPANGSNVFVTFNLKTEPVRASHSSGRQRRIFRRNRKVLFIDPNSSLVLVSCVKSKRSRPARAQDLYTSTLFCGARSVALASGAPWFILSSKYGLVHPDQEIAPYEYTLNKLGVADRRRWAEQVLKELLPKVRSCRQVVFLAGARYREFLIGPLEERGIGVLVPMEGLRFGEQLAWLSEHA